MVRAAQTLSAEPERQAARYRALRIAGSTAFALALIAGCSGGGGSGSGTTRVLPVVTPTPAGSASAGSTPTPGSDAASGALSSNCTSAISVQSQVRHPLTQSTAPVTYTTFTIDSNPRGLAVTLNGSTAGVTPQNIQPTPSDLAFVVNIASASDNVSYCFSQTAAQPKELYFNSVNDTTGSIASISSSSILSTQSAAQSVAHTRINYPRHALRIAPPQAFSADKLLVKYRSTVLAASQRSVLSIESNAGVTTAANLGPTTGATISRVVHVPAGTTLTNLQSTLAADPAVAEVDRIQMRYPLSVTPVYPNDPKFISGDQDQWDLYQIDAPQAWGISEGSPSVNVAIIDTGYDVTAPDLKTKVTYAESVINGTTDTSASAATDTDGHGTNVSGIAAADTNNAIAVAGVGFNTSLQEYRIFGNTANSGGASTSDEAQAIYDAVSHGAKVLSLSLGGTEGDSAADGIDAAEYDAVEYAIAQGVTVVAAAGNERSTSVTSVDYPAAYPGVIAVGASALNDTASSGSRSGAIEYVASYSNAGPALALVAPGGDPSSESDPDPLHWILNLDTSTPLDPSNTCSNASACLAQFAGTSQATPHVSAAAALLYAIDPNITPGQVRTILMNTADNINDARQGAGRLNVYRALAALTPTAPETLPTFQNFRAFAYSNSGGTSPSILDLSFTGGVPVSTTGTFRLSDIPSTATSYRIAVWDDVNGDGIINAGDYIGTSGPCTGTGPCVATNIQIQPVPSGYTLP